MKEVHADVTSPASIGRDSLTRRHRKPAVHAVHRWVITARRLRLEVRTPVLNKLIACRVFGKFCAHASVLLLHFGKAFLQLSTLGLQLAYLSSEKRQVSPLDNGTPVLDDDFLEKVQDPQVDERHDREPPVNPNGDRSEPPVPCGRVS